MPRKLKKKNCVRLLFHFVTSAAFTFLLYVPFEEGISYGVYARVNNFVEELCNENRHTDDQL